MLFPSLFSPSSVYQPPANQQNPPCVLEQVAEERKFHESHTNIPATEHVAPKGLAWTNCAAAKQSSQQQHHGKNIGSKMFQEAGAALGCPAQGQASGGYLEKDNYIRTRVWFLSVLQSWEGSSPRGRAGLGSRLGPAGPSSATGLEEPFVPFPPGTCRPCGSPRPRRGAHPS